MNEFLDDNSEYIITIIIIIILIIISALFSCSETALTAASKAKILQLKKKKNKHAKIVSELLKKPESLIGSILLGNNLVNILASALATSFFIKLFGYAGVVYATLIMTFLILIFAEVLPKTYALKKPEKVAIFIAPLINLIVLIFTPIIVIIRYIVNFTLFIFGIKYLEKNDKFSADDEIRGNIDLQHEEGIMVKNDRDMLEGILDLKQMGVDDVMVHRTNIFSLSIKLDTTKIINKILDSSYTRIPFFKDNIDDFIGILHIKDLLRAINNSNIKNYTIDIKSLLTPIWYVPETTVLQEQLNNFLMRKNHFALVVDEYGETQGLITLEDILEEIVGDIIDEHDKRINNLYLESNGNSVNVDGHVSIRDLNRAMDWNLPQDDAISIAGLIINEIKLIPNVGQYFIFYGFKFEILHKQTNRIILVKVTKL